MRFWPWQWFLEKKVRPLDVLWAVTNTFQIKIRLDEVQLYLGRGKCETELTVSFRKFVCRLVSNWTSNKWLPLNSEDFDKICMFSLQASTGINPLKAELNPIYHLLALLGAHLIFHISRIRVKGTRIQTVKVKASLLSKQQYQIADSCVIYPYYYYYYYYYYFQPRTAALRLIVGSWLDVPTFATRRLHACHHARAPSGGRWNCGREMSGNFA